MNFTNGLTAKQLKNYLIKLEETINLNEVEVVGYSFLTRTKAIGADITWIDFSHNCGEKCNHKLNLQNNLYNFPINNKKDTLELDVLLAILDTINELTNSTYTLNELRIKLIENNVELPECKLVLETIYNKDNKCTLTKDFTNIFKLYELELNDNLDTLVKYLHKYHKTNKTDLLKHLLDW